MKISKIKIWKNISNFFGTKNENLSKEIMINMLIHNGIFNMLILYIHWPRATISYFGTVLYISKSGNLTHVHRGAKLFTAGQFATLTALLLQRTFHSPWSVLIFIKFAQKSHRPLLPITWIIHITYYYKHGMISVLKYLQ